MDQKMSASYIGWLIVLVVGILIAIAFGAWSYVQAGKTKAVNEFLHIQGLDAATPYSHYYFSSFDCNDEMCIGINPTFPGETGSTNCVESCITKINNSENKVEWGDSYHVQDTTVQNAGVSCNTKNCFVLFSSNTGKYLARVTHENNIDRSPDVIGAWHDAIMTLAQYGNNIPINDISVKSLKCDEQYCFLIAYNGVINVLLRISLTDGGFDSTVNDIVPSNPGFCQNRNVNDMRVDCKNEKYCYVMCNTDYNSLQGGVTKVFKNTLQSYSVSSMYGYISSSAESINHIKYQPDITCTNLSCITFHQNQGYGSSWANTELSMYRVEVSDDTRLEISSHDDIKGLDPSVFLESMYAYCERLVDKNSGVSTLGDYCLIPGITDPGILNIDSRKEFSIVSMFRDGQVDTVKTYPVIGKIVIDDISAFVCETGYCFATIRDQVFKFRKNTL